MEKGHWCHSPGCDIGPQCIRSVSGVEVKAEKKNIPSPFLLCPLSGSWAWTPHHFRDPHPRVAAEFVGMWLQVITTDWHDQIHTKDNSDTPWITTDIGFDMGVWVYRLLLQHRTKKMIYSISGLQTTTTFCGQFLVDLTLIFNIATIFQ